MIIFIIHTIKAFVNYPLLKWFITLNGSHLKAEVQIKWIFGFDRQNILF